MEGIQHKIVQALAHLNLGQLGLGPLYFGLISYNKEEIS